MPRPTYPSLPDPCSPPDMKRALTFEPVLPSMKFAIGCAPNWVATNTGPVPALVMTMLLVPVVVVVIVTTPPDTVRFPVTCASLLTSSVGALTVWDTNRFPKTLCELVTVRLEVLMLDAESVLFPVTMISSDDVIPAALKVPVMSAGPPTTKLAVASKLETDIVLGSLLLLSVPEVMFDAFNVLIPAPEPIILDALKVPVMSAGPVTKRLDVLRLDAESVLFPVTVISSDDVIPAALKVPVMSAGPPTTKLAVASKLETDIVLGSLLLLSVPEVTLDAFRSDKASPEPIKSVAFTLPMTSNF